MPPTPPPHPTPLGCHRLAGWAPVLYSNFPLAIYFTYSNVYISVLKAYSASFHFLGSFGREGARGSLVGGGPLGSPLGFLCESVWSASPESSGAQRPRQEATTALSYLPNQGKKQLPDAEFLNSRFLLRRKFIPDPQGHQPHVCLLCPTLHPSVLQTSRQDGSWLLGAGPTGWVPRRGSGRLWALRGTGRLLLVGQDPGIW